MICVCKTVNCNRGAICLFFFFSSRRRHTRCLSDWSSDVCSSDLTFERKHRNERIARNPRKPDVPIVVPARDLPSFTPDRKSVVVGKECRSRWSADHEKNRRDKESISIKTKVPTR